MGTGKLFFAAIATTFAGFALPSFADDIYVTVDPPARRVERYEMRPGQVWVPGVWMWNNGKHEWRAGHYVAARKGYRYTPHRSVLHHESRGAYPHRRWERDHLPHTRHPPPRPPPLH